MAIHDLARKETAHGTVTAVWFDSQEENFVVQHPPGAEVRIDLDPI